MKDLVSRIVNSLRRNNLFKFIYYIIFKPELSFSNNDISSLYIFKRTQTPWIKYRTVSFDKKINDCLNEWSKIEENEYLIFYKNKCMLEPYFGWIINSKNEVLKQSLPYGISEKTPLPHYIFYKQRKGTNLDCAVSIRYNWFNYWHFYNDILGQLYLLDKIKFDRSIPIIIPRKALELSYVKEFFETKFSKQFNWIFQGEETYISLDSVYLCKSIPNIKEHFIFATTIFKKNFQLQNLNKKIFVTRNARRGRYLYNSIEIEFLLKKHSFEIVECDDLSVEEQIRVFASAETIIGIHGAGLTNIIYRYPLPCTLIEIFPPGFTPPHYYWLAKELNFDYHAISGNKPLERAFSISSEDLINVLN